MRSLVTVLVCIVTGSCGAPGRDADTTTPVASREGTAAPGASTTPPTDEAVPLGPLPGDVRPTYQTLVLDIDPARARFGGTADIALQLARPRDRIWLHGRGLAVRSATVIPSAGPALVARWEEVDPVGVVRVSLPSKVSGHVTLRVEFDAPYDDQLVGVYRVSTASGPAVFTKFEAIYARRAFPCFDEPAFKIPFEVTLTVPHDDTVIGNMPVASERVGAGRKRVRFQATPPLPSYLVAFAVGRFDVGRAKLLPSQVRPQELPIRAVAMRGRGAATGFALAEAPKLLAEQERYFGLAFPFPKLDLIAAPEHQSGAMENAGAITFRESALLVDDRVTTLGQRVDVTEVIAHELAHQWFGDLVTMRWWDDLWLNEGFATFLATQTLRAVHPELEAELAAAGSRNDVMNVDGLASARRIRQPIATTHDITNAFDGITYEKGAAVLAMIEHFIGEQAFRRGLHELLVTHARGNATTEDLVQALAKASGRELRPLIRSFLEQPGVPAVSARLSCDAGRGRALLAQSRWQPAGGAVRDAGVWAIPVCVRAGIGPRVEEACTLLTAKSGTLELPGCADWILPNAQAAGYYRSLLGPDELARLRDRGLRQLSTVERLMFARDLEAGFRSAALPGADVLRALEPFARDPHGAVAGVPLELFGFVHSFIASGPERATLRARVRALVAPALASLGWKPAAGESTWRRLYRGKLLRFLALDLEDPAVLAEAARLGRRMLGLDGGVRVRHPDAVAPDLAGLALAAAARKGDARVFEALVAELAGSDDAQVRQRVLLALGQVRAPALVGRALDLALDPRLRQQERIFTLSTLLGALETRDAAWAWLEAHFDALAARLPDRSAGRLPLLFTMCDPQRIANVRAFFAPRIDKLTGGPRNLAQAIERAEQCIARVNAQRASVQAYLQ